MPSGLTPWGLATGPMVPKLLLKAQPPEFETQVSPRCRKTLSEDKENQSSLDESCEDMASDERRL